MKKLVLFSFFIAIYSSKKTFCDY